MSNLRSRQPGKTFLTTIAALALLAALSTLGVRAAAAEAALVEVEIPAGPLDRSLLAISSAFNVDILAPDELIADRRAVALSGALSAAEALDRVLQGSGLEARPAEDGAYLVAENGEETEEEPIQMAPLDSGGGPRNRRGSGCRTCRRHTKAGRSGAAAVSVCSVTWTFLTRRLVLPITLPS